MDTESSEVSANPSGLLSFYRVEPGLLGPQPLLPTPTHPHTREDGLAFVYPAPCPLVFLKDYGCFDSTNNLDLEKSREGGWKGSVQSPEEPLLTLLEDIQEDVHC